jgi:protoporphyrinogen IX oxidase
MPWLKFLHIVTLVIWCGALLYLPALLWQSLSQQRIAAFDSIAPSLPRLFFNGLATPAALLTIISGTLLFLLHGLLGGWLIFKLVAVAGMVVSHALLGWLVIRLEAGSERGLRLVSLGCALLAGLNMLAVFMLVLTKPLDWSGGLP